MIKEIPVEEYQENAKQAINSAKDVVSESPVDEFKGKTGKAYDSAEGMIKEIPSEDYQEKVEQAINSAKNPVSDNQVDECKEKAGQECNVITEKGIDTYVKDSVDEVGKGSSLQRKESYNDTNTEKSFFSKYKQFIFGAVTVIALFGVYQLGVNNSKNDKPVTTNLKQEDTTSTNIAKTSMHKENQQNKVNAVRIGYINGDDVFVRSQPSTDSKPITMLNKKTRVEVLRSQLNNIDSATYILKVDGCIGYDVNSSQQFTLNKGLALKYEYPGKLPNQVCCKIQTAVGEKTVVINNFSNVAEKIVNNDWYNIRLSDGKTGWIYSKFVDVSLGE